MNSKISLILVLCVILAPQSLFAYATPAHNKLTKATFKAYAELRGSDTLSLEDGITAGKGAVFEDDMQTSHVYPTAKRPLNHFYDPIHKTGLYVGTTLGMPSPLWVADTLAQKMGTAPISTSLSTYPHTFLPVHILPFHLAQV